MLLVETVWALVSSSPDGDSVEELYRTREVAEEARWLVAGQMVVNGIAGYYQDGRFKQGPDDPHQYLQGDYRSCIDLCVVEMEVLDAPR